MYLQSGKIYKLNPTSGAVVDSIQSPSPLILGITYLDGFLYGVDIGNHQIYKMNPSNGQVTDSASWQVPYPLGLLWDESYIGMRVERLSMTNCSYLQAQQPDYFSRQRRNSLSP